MSEKLRIGMIGCGEIAVQTAAGIAAAPNAAHVMVMDVNEGVARDLGETYGVPYTTKVDKLLADPQVQAVYIAVPHYLHAPLTVHALQAGKHVLVEKPIATTLADADAMIAAAKETNLVLSVAFHANVFESLRQVKTLIVEGTIGKVTGTRIVYRGRKPDSYWQGGYSGRIQTDWRIHKDQSGGGVLIMNAVHDLNTMRFLTGLEVSRVYGESGTFTTPVEVEDYIALTYRYNNDAIGTLEAGSAITGRDPLDEVNRIYGETGQIILSDPVRVYVSRDVHGLKAGEWQVLPKLEEDDRLLIVDAFARAAKGEHPPVVRGEDGRTILEFILAAYQSCATHCPVDLAQS